MPPRGEIHRRHFRFRSVWRLPAPAARVYAVLERAEEYPRWWPQVREAHRLDEHSGTARIRSVLPYDLEITCYEARSDPGAKVVETELFGDMTGWARWTVTGGEDSASQAGAVAVYEQQVELTKPLLRLLATPVKPLLRANHALMMRAGERGLRRWLERGLDQE
jgi:uncharacterized protein YndB with AHSA1/START domain